MCIANVYVCIEMYYMCLHPHMRLDAQISAAQTKVEFKLYVGQSVADYI